MKHKKKHHKKFRREVEKYMNNMNTPVYESRILAFVDILGFKNMVLASDNNYQEQQRILKAMSIIHRVKELNDSGSDGGLRRYGIHVTTFSDSAIISYPLSHDGGLFYVLMDLIHLQIDLLMLGIFIRGGITIGAAHHDEFNAFGPAMVEAYELESKKAVYPRMILTEETIKTGLMYSPSHQNQYDICLFSNLIRQDTDGFFYLDYLTQSQEFDYPVPVYYKWMQSVRHAIVSNLNASYGSANVNDQRIYEKYRWMLTYWNSVLTPAKLTYPVEAGLSKEELQEVHKAYLDLRIDPGIIPYK